LPPRHNGEPVVVEGILKWGRGHVEGKRPENQSAEGAEWEERGEGCPPPCWGGALKILNFSISKWCV